MNTDNIDRFGHCVICHKNLMTKKVVDGKVVDMFLPIYDLTDFVLDNGSIMKVCICKPDKDNTDLNDPIVHQNIMEAVIKGWQLEVDGLVASPEHPDWTEERAKKYMDEYSQRSIDSSADSLDSSALEARQQELFQTSIADAAQPTPVVEIPVKVG